MWSILLRLNLGMEYFTAFEVMCGVFTAFEVMLEEYFTAFKVMFGSILLRWRRILLRFNLCLKSILLYFRPYSRNISLLLGLSLTIILHPSRLCLRRILLFLNL